jgi:hypothetical protein
MKRFPLFLLAFCGFLSSAIAQSEPCGTDRLLQSIDAAAYYDRINALIQSHLASPAGKLSTTITIPTVFHVVYNTPVQNIADSMIYQQLQILNDDFQRHNADTVNTPVAFQSIAGRMDIEFCLAQQTPTGASTTGIVRVPTSVSAFNSPTTYSVPDPVKHAISGGSDAWDTETYLNIWVCNLNGSTAYSAPPGNFMPDDEGVVCKYQHVGITNVYPYGKGRSIVHEVGHYFCLKHIWGDDQGGCTGTDYIGDTPNQSNYSTNCPTFPLTDACSPNSPGVMFMNYMDYSEDGCRNMFSAGQAAYMASCISSLRPGFLTAQGCVPVVGVVEEIANPVFITQTSESIVVRSESQWMESIRIFDLGGRELGTSHALQSHEASINTRGLGYGIYILEVRFADGNAWRGKLKQ